MLIAFALDPIRSAPGGAALDEVLPLAEDLNSFGLPQMNASYDEGQATEFHG